MKSSGRGSRRNTAIRFLTWKDMAERRKEVMDMVAQEVSWAKAGGTNRFVRLPMSLIRQDSGFRVPIYLMTVERKKRR